MFKVDLPEGLALMAEQLSPAHCRDYIQDICNLFTATDKTNLDWHKIYARTNKEITLVEVRHPTLSIFFVQKQTWFCFCLDKKLCFECRNLGPGDPPPLIFLLTPIPPLLPSPSRG